MSKVSGRSFTNKEKIPWKNLKAGTCHIEDKKTSKRNDRRQENPRTFQ